MSSSEQRRGRAGRTKPGKYYVMATEREYSKLQKTRADEIERVPLTDTIMSLISVGLDPAVIIKKLSIERKTHSINELKRLKLIDFDTRYFVTEKGKFSTKFDISVYTAASLYDMLQKFCNVKVIKDNITTIVNEIEPLHIAAILVMIDVYEPPYFRYPNTPKNVVPRDFKIAHRTKYFEKYRGETDVHVFGNIWNDLMDFTEGYDKLNGAGGLKLASKWCDKNSINFKQIKELLKSLRSVVSNLRKMGYVIKDDLQNSKFHVNEVISKIKNIITHNYKEFEMQFIGYGGRPIYVKNENTYHVDLVSNVNNIEDKLPMAIIALSHNESVSKQGMTMRFITLYIDSSSSGRSWIEKQDEIMKKYYEAETRPESGSESESSSE
jgi:HrpA-like RNA helicase